MTLLDASNTPATMEAALAAQRRACLDEGPPSLATRLDRLKRLEAVLVAHQREWCAALDEDFGGRPTVQSRMELSGTLSPIRYAREHVRKWMKPSRRPVPLIMRLTGAKAEVLYQPLGVVGVVAPWNFPLTLSLGALASVFAAGNRAMLKPSELSPHSSALLKQLLDATFEQTELATFLGGADVGEAFTHLAFDHLLFTGSPRVAKHAMRAAAQNLVPVTLELGGKCPVIVGPEADLDLAADRVMWGKIQNAGQICLAPDYLFVPKGREEDFIDRARRKVQSWYSQVGKNRDYCSIINARQFERLMNYVEEARARGVRIEALADVTSSDDRRIPPTIIVQPADDLSIMQEEIFGPLLPLRTYTAIDEVIRFINAKPRPLALYYFGTDRSTIRQLKEHTTSGGITINDIAMHAATESLPLGGVGNSGMGRYHGHDGFLNFSHHKAVLTQGRISLGKMFNPPYDDKKTALLDRVIGKPMN